MLVVTMYSPSADELNARLAALRPDLDLRVDAEFLRAIKPSPAWQKDLLERDLLAAGRALRPLLIWNGLLVDGHRRLEVCLRHVLPFEVEDLVLPDRAAVLDWIRRLHPYRRW